MRTLASKIMEWAESRPEAAPIRPNALLHFGAPASIRQALTRLVRRGLLMRLCPGVYLRTTETPYGRRAPHEPDVIQNLAEEWGETITPNGGAALNVLGLCEQNVIESVYWTSGPNRRLRYGKREIILRHVPGWQLAAADRPAGTLLRALAALGQSLPHDIEDVLQRAVPRLSAADREEFAMLQGIMPMWLARPVNKWLAHG